ncbi:hypothetical protein, partial [Actinophytocola sp.]|uniref:hypothetical protein n=1 Tax=Actinophytocola sp. TaxID=1872138 RepID=UPI002ED9703C
MADGGPAAAATRGAAAGGAAAGTTGGAAAGTTGGATGAPHGSTAVAGIDGNGAPTPVAGPPRDGGESVGPDAN